MKTRHELIKDGKVWQITRRADGDDGDVVHECSSKSACWKWMKAHGDTRRAWNHGKSVFKFGKVIWEPGM